MFHSVSLYVSVLLSCSGEKRRFKNNLEDDSYFLSFAGDVCFCFDNISVLLLLEIQEQYKYFEIKKKLLHVKCFINFFSLARSFFVKSNKYV